MITESRFLITKMDCPSEEQLIRISLEPLSHIHHLDFRIDERELRVFHEYSSSIILEKLNTLQLGTTLLSEVQHLEWISPKKNDILERRLLWQVLGINFFFFLLEVTTGWLSNSLGLIADSFDMLADSFVYLLALFAIGTSAYRKKITAQVAGYLQLFLAILGLVEVFRRVLYDQLLPIGSTMIVISFLALMGNATCLWLLNRSKSNEAHMKASMIFTSNDIIINSGVMLAGGLVYLTNSIYPDLIIGCLVFLLVSKGAFTILKLQ